MDSGAKEGKKDHYVLPLDINVNIKAYRTVLHFRIPSSLFPKFGFHVLRISLATL